MSSRVWNVLRWIEHIIALYVGWNAWKVIRQRGLKSILTRLAISTLKSVPGGAKLMAKEQEKTISEIRAFTSETMGEFDEVGEVHALPELGWSQDKLIPAMQKLRGAEKDFRSGKAFGGIYCDDKKLKEAINKAYCDFADSNGLFPGIFPALRKFELDLIRVTRSLLHGNGKSVQGTVTSGGSESIVIAMKAYKEYAHIHMGITEPEAIVPVSAHPAFAKACDYFGIRLILAQCRSDTGRVDVEDVRQKITSNTIVIVASAPSYPHGCIDPVAQLGPIALKAKCGLHVDACLGGFLLPFLEKRNRLRPEATQFDFRVAGVTSMSADIHKYGFGPKGSSVVLFRDSALRRESTFAWTEWSGGMYCSPGVAGSRAGGIMASAWATVMLLGVDGYMRLADQCWETFSALCDGIRGIKGIKLVGEPDAACIAIRCSDGPETKIYQVASAMKIHFGWNLNYMQKPIACGIQVGARSDFDHVKFLQDLVESLRLVEADSTKYSKGLASIYGSAANLGDREVVGDLLKSYMDELYKC